eukprot:156668-Amphidinium_carterae.1
MKRAARFSEPSMCHIPDDAKELPNGRGVRDDAEDHMQSTQNIPRKTHRLLPPDPTMRLEQSQSPEGLTELWKVW